MFDIVGLLNIKMAANPMWRSLAEKVEDYINSTVGGPVDQAMNAIGNPYRYLRGDNIDPRSAPDIEAVDGADSLSYQDMLTNRERVANIRVILPSADAEGIAQIYADIDGTTYVTSQPQFHDRLTLVQEAKNLGFDYFSDDLSDADYARILLFISQYWPQSGSHAALQAFLGFIHDIRISLVQLWTTDDGTDDFNTLERYNGHMLPVWDGGKHYPTFHYDLLYDTFTDINTAELSRLFYALAPIHLVLRRMVETVRANGTAYAVGAPTVNVIHSMRFRPQEVSKQGVIRYKFPANLLNIPLQLVSAAESNLTINGISVTSTQGNVWILNHDPTIANPTDPVNYMKQTGVCIRAYNSADERTYDAFSLPAFGVWTSGIWVMAEHPATCCIVIT